MTGTNTVTDTQDVPPFTFPLLITEADPVRLRATAAALQQAISEASKGSLVDGRSAMADLDSLFSMPEAQAAEIWRILARQQNANTDWVASELAGLRSATGADILAEMLDNPNITSTSVSKHLNDLYNTGNPGLREHIRAISARHGLSMPQYVGGPIVID